MPDGGWAIVLALLGLVVSLVVGIYTARSNRKAARETAEMAGWPAMVQALQAEVARLQSNQAVDIDFHMDALTQLSARVTALERDNKD